MTHLRIISDTHGLHTQHIELINNCEYTIQVGDFGYETGLLREKLRVGKDFCLAGNHQNYDKESPEYCMNQPFSLKNFGVLELPNFEPIFYVRGAWSIDWKTRMTNEWHGGQKTWFKDEEELSYTELSEAIELYRSVKPNFVISHECPYEVVEHVTNPRFVMNFGYEPGTIRTRTNMALQSMLEIHSPKVWVHGHYHTRKTTQIGQTRFECLDMLGRTPSDKNAYIDFSAKTRNEV